MSRLPDGVNRLVGMRLLGAVAPLVAFAFLAEEAAEHERQGWDTDVAALLGRLPVGIGDRDAVAEAGIVVALLAAITVPLALLAGRRMREAAFWTVALGGLALLDPFVRFAFSRPPGASEQFAETLAGRAELVLPTATALALVVLAGGRKRRLPVAIVARPSSSSTASRWSTRAGMTPPESQRPGVSPSRG